MAREVNTVLAQIIAEQRNVPESKAEEIVKSMRSANQYQVCILLIHKERDIRRQATFAIAQDSSTAHVQCIGHSRVVSCHTFSLYVISRQIEKITNHLIGGCLVIKPNIHIQTPVRC
jgi:hypothetical protein